MNSTDIRNGSTPAGPGAPDPTPPQPVAAPSPDTLATTPDSAFPSEGSWIGRFVALFTPVLAIFAGWFAGWIARTVPGAHLDPTQVTAFMVAAVTTVLAAGLQWLHGWQQHEKLVAMAKATPVVPARSRSPLLPR